MKWLVPLLFIPTIMLLMAVAFYYKQPKRVNPIYGYRTGLSMKNQDTWLVANRLASECFLYTSMSFLAGLILVLTAIGKAHLVSWFGSLRPLFFTIAVLSTVLVVLPLIVTEYRLRRIFTNDGLRK